MKTKWPTVTLGEVLLEPISYGANCAAVEFSERLPRYLRITDIDDRGALIEDRKVSAALQDPRPYRLRPDDILLARSGATVGKSYLHEMKGDQVVFAGYLLRVRVDGERLLPVVLKAQLETEGYWNWVRSTCRAGAQPNINASEYARMPVILPPLELQRAASSVVQRFRELETQIGGLVAEKRRLKRALMQLLLPLRRASKAKEVSRQYRLADVCDIDIGRTPSRDAAHYWCNAAEGGFPWITIRDMREARVSEGKDWLTSEGVASSGMKPVAAGTVLMSFKLTIGRVAVAGCDLFTNEAIAAFRPKNGLVEPEYLAELLPHVAATASTDQAVKGATLNKAKLRALPVWLPPTDFQRAACVAIRAINEQIQTFDHLLAALRLQKRGVMQKLLSGELQ
ncbi:MAG: restriction endonuclease subunit S [Candidatus Eisenbacteria bacterium]|nr:restriction endonuclease subunit S [Candidatus Eisenbacteria bacterium]